MLWLIIWTVYGVMTIIAFVLIGMIEDLQSNNNPVLSYDNLTLFGKITRLIVRLIMAALWLPLLFLLFILYTICEIKEKRSKSKIDPA